MPLYEFVCTDCTVTTDVFSAVADRDAVDGRRCPSCGSSALRRALSTVAVGGSASAAALASAGADRAGGGCCGGGCCGG